MPLFGPFFSEKLPFICPFCSRCCPFKKIGSYAQTVIFIDSTTLHLPASSSHLPLLIFTLSPPDLLTSSPSHVLTSSPSHLLTSSPPHVLTSSPPDLLTSSPPHPGAAVPRPPADQPPALLPLLTLQEAQVLHAWRRGGDWHLLLLISPSTPHLFPSSSFHPSHLLLTLSPR